MALKNLVPKARVPKVTPMTNVKRPVPIVGVKLAGGTGKKKSKKGK